MCDPQTGNWIVFNGEIYNFQDIAHRPELRHKKFHSRTDTEVVLKAYAQWGRECLDKFRGMFAFALWDAQKRELWCVRDRLGIKPFYYSARPGFFVLASEVRALLASDTVAREINPTGLQSFLNFGAVRDPLTIVRGVYSLLPGHWLRVSAGGEIIEDHCYWSLLDVFTSAARRRPSGPFRSRRTCGPCLEPAVRELRSLLEEAVGLRLISDVPLGAFLSGGVDSSAVVALMARASSRPVKTFSVVFGEEGKQDWNEAPYSRVVARQFATDHTEIDLTEEKILRWIPDALAAIDQPTMDGINSWVVSKVTKEAGVTVALSGLGGDELFGGYPSFGQARRVGAKAQVLAGRLPARLRHFAVGCTLAATRNSIAGQKMAELLESGGSIVDMYAAGRTLFTKRALTRLLEPGPQTGASPMGCGPCAPHSRLSDLDHFNAISYLEMSDYMANMLLRDTDTTSMASALEVRVPLIDHRVVEFAARLPGHAKRNGADAPKPLLVAALGSDLPRSVSRRRKMGFILPFERWLRGPLQQLASEHLARARVWKATGIDSTEVTRLWKVFLRGNPEVTWSRVWALCVLSDWCRRNLGY